MGIYSDILLTADYDHTLTGPEGTIPKRNLDAIRFFMENGGAFTLNTGRSIPMIQPFKDIVPVNAPLLLYNGGGAYDLAKKEMVFCHEIDLSLWQVAKDCMERFPDLTFEVQGVDAHYCFTENPAFGVFSENNHCAWAQAMPGDDLGPFLKFTLYGAFHEPTMQNMYAYTPEEKQRMDEVEALLRQLYGDHCAVFRAAPRIIDVQTKGVSKGRSAVELKRQLGKKILISIGDGMNDMPVLDAADYAFCPAGSIVAKWYPNVCSCSEGAVADLIYNELPKIVKNKA